MRGGLSWATVPSHDVLVRVVVRPRHRVTPQQQGPVHCTLLLPEIRTKHVPSAVLSL